MLYRLGIIYFFWGEDAEALIGTCIFLENCRLPLRVYKGCAGGGGTFYYEKCLFIVGLHATMVFHFLKIFDDAMNFSEPISNGCYADAGPAEHCIAQNLIHFSASAASSRRRTLRWLRALSRLRLSLFFSARRSSRKLNSITSPAIISHISRCYAVVFLSLIHI